MDICPLPRRSIEIPTSGCLSLLLNDGVPDDYGLKHATKHYRQIQVDKSFDPDQDVFAYSNYLAKMGPEVAVSEPAKCNRMAQQLRQQAKSLFQQNCYAEALHMYGKSVLWAEPGTSAVGIAYAGRAAAYHMLGEYEYSLIYIKMAKENGYPEKYWPTVDCYEEDCKAKLKQGQSKSAGLVPKLGLNVEPNPKIPFLAKGIRTEHLPDYGRGLVAERDFTSGDVILHEKPMMAAVVYGVEHYKCSLCTTPIMSRMVPCPDCVTAVYCGQRCLEEDKKWFHRYECGIMAKLRHISCRKFVLGPKMFFYGLGLFNGDLDQFMKFCKANGRTGSDPITLDYTNLDRLEEFKVFHCAEEPPTKFKYGHFSKLLAALYCSVYMKQPQLAALFSTKDQQDFFLTQTLDYMRMVSFLSIGKPTPYNSFTVQHFSIASLCNHACYPNTMALYHAGHLKFVVIRPIKKGQQITIPYVSPIEEFRNRTDQLKVLDCIFVGCVCDLCDLAKALTLKMVLMKRGAAVASGQNKSMGPFILDGRILVEELRMFCEQYLQELPSKNTTVLELTNSYRLGLGMEFINDVEAFYRNQEA